MKKYIDFVLERNYADTGPAFMFLDVLDESGSMFPVEFSQHPTRKELSAVRLPHPDVVKALVFALEEVKREKFLHGQVTDAMRFVHDALETYHGD